MRVVGLDVGGDHDPVVLREDGHATAPENGVGDAAGGGWEQGRGGGGRDWFQIGEAEAEEGAVG